ncbi:Blue-light-activated protein [Stieleria maiorica]|uniref:histidine kinase n=1 Tax=Stieleria maiorica TaxID=2795974 RepID=A0A5B9MKB6_9BACT|nr:ATP-binding protein [Stieleria maiorica]QEF99387.1 Blue-light-activated protein [Stieleria maiorica]
MPRLLLLLLLSVPGILLTNGILLTGSAGAQQPASIARTWQFQSFFRDAHLAEKSIAHVDAAADGSLWFAVSDGLYHYDGYYWTRYTTADGLPSDYVRCVLVDNDGTLWVGTDQGVAVFDGTTFDSDRLKGRLAGPSLRRIVQDTDGSLWFCCDQWPKGGVPAGLTRMKDGQFTTWGEQDGLPSNYVSDYIRTSDGRQFVLTNVGLAEFTEDGFREPLKEAGLWREDAYVWSMVESQRHGLLVSTGTHFYQFSEGAWRRISNGISNLDQPKLVATRDGEIFTCSTGRGPVVFRWDGDGWVDASRQLNDVVGGVLHLMEDGQGAVWIVGSERLLRWERTAPEWQVFQNVGAPLHRDRSGGIWFVVSRGGLVRWASGRSMEYPKLYGPIYETSDGALFMESNDGLRRWEKGRLDRVDLQGYKNPRLLGIDGRDVVWVAALDQHRGRFIVGIEGGRLHARDVSRFTNRIRFNRSTADPQSGVWIIFGSNNSLPFHLVRCDRDFDREIPLPEKAQISHLPNVLPLADGTLFASGYFGLMKSTDEGRTWSEIEMPSAAVGGLVALDGEIWATCSGYLGGQAALVRMRDGNWKSILDRNGRVVGQNGAQQFFASSQGKIEVVSAGVTTLPPPVATTPFETRVGSVVAGASGELWVGVGSRCFRYQPDQYPPETEVVGGDGNLNEGEALRLRVRGLERFRPKRTRRHFLVSAKVDDQSWTPFESLGEELSVPALPLGEHRIAVRVQDAAGQIDPTPAVFQFSVMPLPLQSRAWFKPAVAFCFATILALAILAGFNWARVGKMARGLEREVARKTSRIASSEREFRLLFEDSQDAICLFGNDGMLKSCNRVGRELLGLLPEPGIAFSSMFAGRDEALRFQSELSKADHLRGARFKLQTVGGKPLDAILSVNRQREADGALSGFQVIIRDISTLVDLQNQLSETKKMEAIGRMAGGIAHDFNNFLAVVMYGAEFVRLSADGNAAVDQGVQMILDAAQRGRHLTGQIQTFSRTSTGKLNVVDTGKVLAEIDPLLRGVLESAIELKYDVAESIDHVRADRSQLEQVLINLAINAAHAMPDGGTLTIGASNVLVAKHELNELRLDRPGPYVVIEVADCGHGMDAATCERIFDPFFTTKPHGQGTGLGLAIVYGIVQQFRGQIAVESRVGHGTRFIVHLPATKEPVGDEEPAATQQDPAQGSETVLFVEDEQAIRDLACKSLRQYGYRVVAAADGLQAKRLIESNQAIDLVISDVAMPGMSGTALLNWLRRVRPNLPVLLITGHADPASNKAIEAIEVPCLRKPFLPAALALQVREILDRQVASHAS